MTNAKRKIAPLPMQQVQNAINANQETRALGERLRTIKRQIAALELEAQQIVTRTIKVLGLGCYEDVTIYKVGETWVKRHQRKAYTAVRSRLKSAA